MKKLMILAVLVGLSAVSGSASAQDAGGGAPPAKGDAAAATTTYDFDDDLVTGDLVRPDGENLVVRRRGQRASLIQIREHFIPEMLKSVENL